MKTNPTRGQNICKLFHVLAKFLYTTKELELVYYQQKINELPHELMNDLKPSDLGNYEISRKSLNTFELMTSSHPATYNPNFKTRTKILQKYAVKHSEEKPILLKYYKLTNHRLISTCCIYGESGILVF